MQGRSGTGRRLVHLLAGAALGAAVVLVLWIFSGGRPFGEVVGSADVSPATPAAVEPSGPQERAGTPASAGAQLEPAPPAIGRSRTLQFRKKEPSAKARAKARAKRKARRAAARRKQVVRVVSPPATPAGDEELPVAVVPSPAPTAVPAPPAPPAPAGGGGKPAKAPTYTAGAGEG